MAFFKIFSMTFHDALQTCAKNNIALVQHVDQTNAIANLQLTSSGEKYIPELFHYKSEIKISLVAKTQNKSEVTLSNFFRLCKQHF